MIVTHLIFSLVLLEHAQLQTPYLVFNILIVFLQFTVMNYLAHKLLQFIIRALPKLLVMKGLRMESILLLH